MKAFVFDTETTGLIKNSLVPLEQQPRIIEFCGELVDLESGEVIKELDFICNPQQTLEAVITRITGLTQAQVDAEKPFSHRADEVIDLIQSAEAVVAHNLSFDRAMVDNDLKRCEKSVNWPSRMVCTVEQTEWMRGHRLNLTSLHEELFGEPFSGAHRAREDVKALTRCTVELFRRGEL